jgi:hypothetical protein
VLFVWHILPDKVPKLCATPIMQVAISKLSLSLTCRILGVPNRQIRNYSGRDPRFCQISKKFAGHADLVQVTDLTIERWMNSEPKFDAFENLVPEAMHLLALGAE